MSWVKTDYRRRMREEVIGNQMRIYVDGPDIENFSSSFFLFFKPPRLSVCPYGKRGRDPNKNAVTD